MRDFPVLKSRNDVNLWAVPFRMGAGAVGLFILTMIPDTLASHNVIHLPWWFTMGGIDDARAILSTMLGCVSTVLALIFSVALLMLSMMATLFGPRLLYRFVQDWVTQVTIGMFMAAFIYVFLVFLVTHQSADSSFIPQVSLITSWLLVLTAFGFLVYYSHRIALSIQNPDAIARIVDDFRNSLRHSTAKAQDEKIRAQALAAFYQHQNADSGKIDSHASGYVQEIEIADLVEAAERAGAQLEFFFRPGQFVLNGEILARVWPKAQTELLAPLVQKKVWIGRHRILSQDSEFGIAQIVEIGIRALSPAVNDTFTGVACVDWLGEALLTVAETPQNAGCWYDPAGKLRVRIRELKISRMVKMAFDQIRQSAADNPAVLVRILSTLGRVGPWMKDAEDLEALKSQADAVLDSAKTGGLIEKDFADVEAAWRAALEVFAVLRCDR